MKIHSFILGILFYICGAILPKYNYDPRIHTLGNVGIGGIVHSAIAPVFTKVLDIVAYDGRDIRYEVSVELFKEFNKNQILSVLDVGCGTGTSTTALSKAMVERFENGGNVLGIDSSFEMIFHGSLYKNLWNKVHQKYSIDYSVEDIENFKSDIKYDVVFVGYVFHEVPRKYWSKIFKQLKTLAKNGGKIVIIDIDKTYVPSEQMKAGEPFLQEYFDYFNKDIKKEFNWWYTKNEVVLDKHVQKWIITN